MDWLLKILLRRSKKYKLVVPLNPQAQVLDGKFRTVEAFVLNGIKYYQFDDPFNVPAGRFFACIAYYEEINMRCDRDYLVAHTKATEALLDNNKKGVRITHIAQLNINLRERLDLMPLPDFIYRLASVLFFDETERLDKFDYDYAAVKIARWKASPEALDFFLTKPIQELMPSLNLPTENSGMSFQVAKKIDEIHRAALTAAASVV